MKKTRVLHCIETMDTGGVEQRRLMLARYLDKDRYEVKILCTKASPEFHQRFESTGVEVVQVGILKHPFYWPVLSKVIKEIKAFKPEIIHGAVFEGVIMASICGFLSRVPIRLIEETSVPKHRSRKAEYFLKFLSGLTHGVVGTSPAVIEYLKSKVKIRASRLHMVLNGVNTPEDVLPDHVEKLKSELGIGPDDFVIGSSGRIRNSIKRFSDLVRALVYLPKEVKVMVIGKGRDLPELKELATELGVADRVIFPGFQSDVYPCLHCLDVFAMVSSMEGFGLSAVEGMFCGLPVIATPVGGLKNIVLENETGFFVEVGSPEKIAQKVSFLLENPDQKRAMGLAALQRAKDNFQAKDYVKRLDAYYVQLLNAK